MKEYNQKIRSQRLAKELRDAVDGSDNQSEHLRRFVAEQSQDAEELTCRLRDSKRFDEIKSQIEHVDAEEESRRLIGAITTLNHLRSRRNRLRIFSSAAAAVLLLAALFLTQIGDSELCETDHAKELAVNTPILISGGQTINLDQQSSELITDNSLMIAKDDNTLTYTTTTRKSIINELILPAKCVYTVKLVDGSVITLNAASRLRYPTSFDGDRREVYLTGEAYFNVAKSDKPFIVHVGELNIKVYGTEFNINSSRPGKVETLLVEGSVSVSSDDAKEVLMSPNQLAVYNCSTTQIEVENVNARDRIHWMNDCFNYVQVSMTDALSDIGRWYDVRFESCKPLEDIMVTFYSGRDNNIEKLIPLIESIADVKITNKGGGIYSVERVK